MRPILALACLLAVAPLALADPVPTRIMPLGDSITESTVGYSSYRYWLWHDLVDDGYAIDFVGSKNGVFGGLPVFTDFDMDHEGHSGWKIHEMFPLIEGWVTTAAPDVVLLHMGHTNLIGGFTVTQTVIELSELIDHVRAAAPHASILVAQIIATDFGTGAESPIPLYNAAVAQLAASKDAPDGRVITVDQYTGTDPATDTFDGLHPNDEGEQQMAARWHHALIPVLDGCLATSNHYGTAVAGTLGAPAVDVSAPAVLGATVDIELQSSMPSAASGIFCVGFEPFEHPPNGGLLNVLPYHVVMLEVPAEGSALPFHVPYDESYCGFELFLQVLVADPAAPTGYAASEGLRVVVGAV